MWRAIGTCKSMNRWRGRETDAGSAISVDVEDSAADVVVVWGGELVSRFSRQETGGANLATFFRQRHGNGGGARAGKGCQIASNHRGRICGRCAGGVRRRDGAGRTGEFSPSHGHARENDDPGNEWIRGGIARLRQRRLAGRLLIKRVDRRDDGGERGPA